MTLAHPWVLHLLWLLPAAGFALVVQNRRRRRALESFAKPTLLAGLTPGDRKGRRFLKGLLLLGSLALLIVALAGPRWGSRYQEVSRKGVDIMVAVDVSRSMAVSDVKPDRLERARREIVDFLRVVEGDRVGLTAFAGTAFVQCPLTLDYAALEMFLGALQPGIIPVPGTDLGVAVETAMSGFDFKSETDKVLLLITDGEDNEGRGLEAARAAAGKGVKIFVFGIGDPSGGPVPAADGKGGFTKDKDGKLVLSRLDEATLQQMATITGGGYVRSVAGDLDLDMLYFEGIRHKTQARTLKSGKIRLYEERFYIFILAAFVLLIVEETLEVKRRTARRKRFGFPIALMLCALLLPGLQRPSQAADSPDKLYRGGRYAEAEKAYAQSDMDHPRDIRYRYNRGCAAFQNGKYKEAAAAFSSVLRRAEDDAAVRFKAAYNLGNTAFKQADYASAADYYQQALVFDPASTDARHNLELALRKIKAEKRKQAKAPKAGQQSGENKGKGAKEEKGAKNSPPEKQETPNRETAKSKDSTGRSNKQIDGSKPDDKTAPGEKRSAESGKTEKPASEESRKTQGELKPLKALPQLQQGAGEKAPGKSDVDKQRAAALLDNVQENPAGILRFMIPKEKGRGAASGKNW